MLFRSSEPLDVAKRLTWIATFGIANSCDPIARPIPHPPPATRGSPRSRWTNIRCGNGSNSLTRSRTRTGRTRPRKPRSRRTGLECHEFLTDAIRFVVAHPVAPSRKPLVASPSSQAPRREPTACRRSTNRNRRWNSKAPCRKYLYGTTHQTSECTSPQCRPVVSQRKSNCREP